MNEVSKGTILIVDDTLPNLRLLVNVLTDQGYQVRGVANGAMALRAVNFTPPDLILLDINMPDMSGYEVCQHLKANEKTKNIPVIFISALDEVLDKVIAFSVGGVDYITKSIQIEEVLGRIEIHLTIGRLQQQLQQTNLELEKRVSERTIELAQVNTSLKAEIEERQVAQERQAKLEKQLYQMQKMEALGCLAGGVAHDFNNLLTVIMGHSELLLFELNDSPLSTDVEQIMKASERAKALTQQLLAFSRRQVIQTHLLNLNSVVSDMEKMLYRLIGENIKLHTQLEPQLQPIKADRGQLEQVIMNLAINARDAMPDGGDLTFKTCNVKLTNMDTNHVLHVKPDNYVCLIVTDNGLGMADDIQPHIFEPFFTTKQAEVGTGLGLSTVHGIVTQNLGYIFVQSELQHGTTFHIYFPQNATLPISMPAPPIPPKNPTQTKTVLLVEDELNVRLITRRLLEQHNYYVIEASSGHEALQRCHEQFNPIHLLLTDVIMADMNGPALAQQIRQLSPQTKILYMSGYTGNVINQSGFFEANAVFLEKPFTQNDLLSKVQEVLGK